MSPGLRSVRVAIGIALAGCYACGGGPHDTAVAMVPGSEDLSSAPSGLGTAGAGSNAGGTSNSAPEAASQSPSVSMAGAATIAAVEAPAQEEGNDGGTGDPPSVEAGAVDGDGTSGALPSPAADGTTPYAVECRGASLECGGTALRCLGVGVSESGAGYACSNRCVSKDDCSAAPATTDAEVDCVPLTSAAHCLLVCQRDGTDFACPGDMQCYTYPGSYIGYCLYL